MDERSIGALRYALESDLVERKSSAADGDTIREAICAFANDLPDHKRSGIDLTFFERSYLKAAVAPDVLAGNQRSPTDQLRARRFIDADDCPTVLGVLVSAFDPRSFLPGAYVQFVRFDGRELSAEIRSQHEVDGPLSEMLLQLDEILEANNSTSSSISAGAIEVKQPEYPMLALQQLTRNAVLHRTYEGTNAPVRVYWFDDRIEIQSPGGPCGQVSIEHFGESGATDYRNPSLAEAMKTLGFVQRFGVGIALAREALSKNGNPPPELVANPQHILCIVRKRP